jgi:hypothetical protein
MNQQSLWRQRNPTLAVGQRKSRVGSPENQSYYSQPPSVNRKLRGRSGEVERNRPDHETSHITVPPDATRWGSSRVLGSEIGERQRVEVEVTGRAGYWTATAGCVILDRAALSCEGRSG